MKLISSKTNMVTTETKIFSMFGSNVRKVKRIAKYCIKNGRMICNIRWYMFSDEEDKGWHWYKASSGQAKDFENIYRILLEKNDKRRSKE